MTDQRSHTVVYILPWREELLGGLTRGENVPPRTLNQAVHRGSPPARRLDSVSTWFDVLTLLYPSLPFMLTIIVEFYTLLSLLIKKAFLHDPESVAIVNYYYSEQAVLIKMAKDHRSSLPDWRPRELGQVPLCLDCTQGLLSRACPLFLDQITSSSIVPSRGLLPPWPTISGHRSPLVLQAFLRPSKACPEHSTGSLAAHKQAPSGPWDLMLYQNVMLMHLCDFFLSKSIAFIRYSVLVCSD